MVKTSQSSAVEISPKVTAYLRASIAEERAVAQFCRSEAEFQQSLDNMTAAQVFQRLADALDDRASHWEVAKGGEKPAPETPPVDLREQLAYHAPDPYAATPYRIIRRALAFEQSRLQDCLQALNTIVEPDLRQAMENTVSARLEGILRLRAAAIAILSTPAGAEDRRYLIQTRTITDTAILEHYLGEQYGIWAALAEQAIAATETSRDPTRASALRDFRKIVTAAPATVAAGTKDPFHGLYQEISQTYRLLIRLQNIAPKEDLLLRVQAEAANCQSLITLLRPAFNIRSVETQDTQIG